MRIVVANKFWYRRAGLERVMFDEIGWLEAAGHEVAHFSTQHPENDPSPWSGYFAPYLEIGRNTTLSMREKAVAVQRMFWNGVAARRFARLLRDFRPDVVHVHGIHRQISLSILTKAHEAEIPVVQTLHDYHPICASGDLLRGGRRACDPPRCSPVNVLPCLVHGCVHGSRARSALGASDLLWRRWALRHERLVDAFISPSRYLADVVRACGIRRRPIHVLPNAIVAPELPPRRTPGDGFVYAGRLSREKGLHTLLRRRWLVCLCRWQVPDRWRNPCGRGRPSTSDSSVAWRAIRWIDCCPAAGPPLFHRSGPRMHPCPSWSRWRSVAP